jgi:deoxyribodipyrimidine photo-lyase
VPLFIFDVKLLQGTKAGSNRNRFLLETLEDLKSSLSKLGGDLVIRTGNAGDILKQIAAETNAAAVYFSADYTPYAVRRDNAIKDSLKLGNIGVRPFPGRLILDDPNRLMSGNGASYKVFTPFWRNWLDAARRDTVEPPEHLSIPSNISLGKLPELEDVTTATELSQDCSARASWKIFRRPA